MGCSLLGTEVLSQKKANVIQSTLICVTMISTVEQLIFFFLHKPAPLQLWITEPWKCRTIFLSGNRKRRASRRLHLIFYPSLLHQKTIQCWHVCFEQSLDLWLLPLCEPETRQSWQRMCWFSSQAAWHILVADFTSSQSLKVGITQQQFKAKPWSTLHQEFCLCKLHALQRSGKIGYLLVCSSEKEVLTHKKHSGGILQQLCFYLHRMLLDLWLRGTWKTGIILCMISCPT